MSQHMLLKSLFKTIPDLVWLKDADGIYLSCNPQFEKLYNTPEENILGKSDYDFVDKDLADFFRKHDLNAMLQDKPTENEEWLTFAANGYTGLFSTIKTPLRDENGQVIGVLGVARDITERKNAELKLERLANLYSAMSQTNEAIVHCQSEEELFHQVCQIAVQYGGMKMAWIGMLDEATQSVQPVANFAERDEYCQYLEQIQISIDADAPSGQGPTGIAVRENHPYWCQDFQHDPRTAAWHERAQRFGWQSSASLPLHRHGRVVGALNIYSDTRDAFDQPAQELLLEMATDIGFALNEFAHKREHQRIEAERQEALDRLQKIAAHLPGVIYQFKLTPDGKTYFPFASEAIRDIYRLSPEEAQSSAAKVFGIIHPDDFENVGRSIEHSALTLSLWHLEYRVKFDDGTVRWLQGNAMPQKEADGSVLWHGFITDVTERKEKDAKIQLASKVFEQSQEGIMITDPDQKILMVNQAFTQISGYTLEEIQGKTPHLLASGRHTKAFYDEMWTTIKKQGFWQGEVWNRRKNGEIFPEWLSISCGTNSKGEVTEYVAMFTDISAVKASEEKIQRLAHNDPLTGLANRQLLMDRLQQSLKVAERSGRAVALLFIDLDHFKNVNDTLGHHIGDELLVEISARMSQVLRAEDTLARQGGDEFIVILPDTDENGAAHVAQKMVEAVAQKVEVEHYDLFITPSIGIVTYPQDGNDAYTLLKNADAAMYQAKHDGRNNYRFFTPQMQAHASRLMQIESALRQAVERNEMSLHYQPQIDAQSHKIIGVEALLRWHHPQMGAISPMEFIPVAEHSGQIIALGEWILQTALQQHKAWLSQGIEPFVIAVNLSAVQLRQPDLPKQIFKALEESGVSPEHLEIELTESVTMSNPESAIKIFEQLTHKGIKIAIDDFGTGYSSLSYLKRFHATKLKIDQSFVRDLTVDVEDLAIVEAIISLAKSLNLKTIAEGVETPEQLALLKARDCDELQGYLFSCPLDSAAMTEFLKRHANGFDSENLNH
ncbi:bifunctional diguanylate cyclase/phosphodiesterase [Thiomicrorhabdus cannonii]|uniref:bifunctional diguanylate cyclase/phosphodiesterase n=1 Tax=Thiomicrorhabdus cannonii TaxID=2748011 RepID=UPI0015B929F7|nr:EAL domain-containing protein [Thiomicrorhabdus cannonii]